MTGREPIRRRPRAGWLVYLGWVLTGTLFAAAIASAATVGILLLPVGVAAGAVLLRRGRAWPESLGAIVGVGLLLLVAGLLNLDADPCGEGRAPAPAGATEASCGGVRPAPLLVAGAIVVIAAVAAYLRLLVAGRR